MKEGEELPSIVLDGSAGEQGDISVVHLLEGSGNARGFVLKAMCLIDDNVLPLDLLVERRLLENSLVGGQQDVPLELLLKPGNIEVPLSLLNEVPALHRAMVNDGIHLRP